MSDLLSGRSAQLDRVLSDLLRTSPEVEAASVVSFDGLPMASALPHGMDENRVAAMSAALLSLGERAAEGLGRGELSQVYVEGETGTVFLISAEDEAVLVAVGARGAKVGLLLYEIRRAAAAVGATLRAEDPSEEVAPATESYETSYETVVEAVPEVEAPADEVVVDGEDPLGVETTEVQPALLTADDLAPAEEAVAEPVEDERELASASAGPVPQPTPDLGAWATFTPGGSASASGDGWS